MFDRALHNFALRMCDGSEQVFAQVLAVHHHNMEPIFMRLRVYVGTCRP
jgi:hypothetical protein